MSRTSAPARWAIAMPSPRRAGRVRRAGVERARAAGGEQRHPRADRDELVVAEDPGACAAVAVAQRGRSPRRARRPGCAGSASTRPISVRAMAAPVAAPPAWRIRRRPWPPSRRELRPAGVGRDPTARPAARGRRSGRTPSRTSTSHRGRIGEAAPHRERVGGVQRRVVVRADRGGDAALGHERVR